MIVPNNILHNLLNQVQFKKRTKLNRTKGKQWPFWDTFWHRDCWSKTSRWNWKNNSYLGALQTWICHFGVLLRLSIWKGSKMFEACNDTILVWQGNVNTRSVEAKPFYIIDQIVSRLYLGVLQTWNVPFWSPALSRYGKGQRCLRPVITKFWSLEGKEAGNIWTEPNFWNFLILSILTDKPRLPMSELSPIHATLKLWKCNVNMRSAEAKPIFKIDKIVSISGVIRTWFFHFGIRLCDTI